MTVLACKALGAIFVVAAVPLVAFGLAIPSTGCMIAAFSLIVAATVLSGGRARRRFGRGSRPLVVVPKGTVASGRPVGDRAALEFRERFGDGLARASKQLAEARPLHCWKCGDHGDAVDRDFALVDGRPVCGRCRENFESVSADVAGPRSNF